MGECLLCDEYIENKLSFSGIFQINNNQICGKCHKRLERVVSGCERCGRKSDKKICDDCRRWEEKEHIVLYNYSLFYYNEYAKEIVKKIKFSGDMKLIQAFRNDLVYFFKHHFSNQNTVLIPVPIHPERLKERGFNQSMAIADLLSYEIKDILIKNNNEKQSKKKKGDRMNAKDNFSLKENFLTDKHCVIIDDIYTTGSTIHQIADILRKQGIKQITGVTLFRS